MIKIKKDEDGIPILKEPERDERGHPIAYGGRTFGKITARHKNASKNRTHDAKIQAAGRLIALMLRGPEADRLTRKPHCTKGRGETFENKREMAKFIFEKIEKLEKTKNKLSNNSPHLFIIEKDIEISTQILRELYKEIEEDENLSQHNKVQERPD